MYGVEPSLEPSAPDAERKRLLDLLVKEIGSPENLARVLPAFESATPTQLASILHDALSVVWKDMIHALMDSDRWRTLAKTPELFESELDGTLERIRKIMRTEYGVRPKPKHRPTTNTERDRQIHRLHAEGRSFGEIGLRFKLTAGAAERACARHVQKQADELRGLLEFLFDLQDAAFERGLAPAPPTLAALTEVLRS
jgi:hypothetical protein